MELSNLTLYEINDLHERKTAEIKTLYDALPDKKLPDGKTAKAPTSDNLVELRKRNDELELIGKQMDLLVAVERAASGKKDRPERTPLAEPGKGADRGDIFVEACHAMEGKRLAKNIEIDFEFKAPRMGAELKTTMTRSAGWAPESIRSGAVIPAVSIVPTLLDFMRFIPTTQAAYKFMKQTTRTKPTMNKAEAAALAEGAIAMTEASVTIEKMGALLPITDEQLADEPSVRAFVEQDLRLMWRQNLEDQAINGDGSTPNLAGILGLSGIQTQAKGTDDLLDAMMKARTKVKRSASTSYGGANPNLFVLNPTDFETIVLQKDANGRYIWGDPKETPLSRIWGVNCVECESIADDTSLVLDTFYFPIIIRQDATLAVSENYSDYFAKNILMLRLMGRAALASLRDTAACKITGVD